jgi:hypothetical protein
MATGNVLIENATDSSSCCRRHNESLHKELHEFEQKVDEEASPYKSILLGRLIRNDRCKKFHVLSSVGIRGHRNAVLRG